jgi:predicted acetyltransferase
VEPDLTLRLPREDEEQEFLRAHHATSPETPSFLHFYEEGMPLRRYLEVLLAQERDVVQSPDVVPETFLFAFVGPRIVGRVAIRHALNDFLKQFGGAYRIRGGAGAPSPWLCDIDPSPVDSVCASSTGHSTNSGDLS